MSDYSALERLLHRMALASPVLAEMLHDMERGAFLKSSPAFEAGRHVFVTGLARAGTTILMRELYATGQFGSLTYADMPFVLAPNLWSKLARRKGGAAEMKERAHGDGIKVNDQSPEALDEVYWRLISGADYIRDDALALHDPDHEAIAGYRDYIRLVLRHTDKTRYLSKNNNTLLRLAALADAWPDTTFLVPFRDPGQHALSLLEQHRRFTNADGFTQDYMTWLGHHEFGATHRPYLFGDRPEGDPETLDYWLSVWIAAYRHALDVSSTRKNVVLVPYEGLTSDPAVWQSVLDTVGLEDYPVAELRQVAPRELPAHDTALAARGQALYNELAAGAPPNRMAEPG